MTQKIHSGDIGQDFRANIIDENGDALDVSGVSEKLLLFRAPDRSTTSKTASFMTDGTDGAIHYITQAGDIDQAGIWTYQPKVTWASGVVLRGTKIPFIALEPIA